MKIRIHVCGMSVICTFAMLLSGQVVFAQKGKILRSILKEPRGTTKIENVVPTKLSLLRRRGAAFRGAAVDRAVVTATQRAEATAVQQAAVSASAARLKGSAKKVAGQETSSARVSEAPSSRVIETPDSLAQSQELEFLTSLETLEKYHPQ